MHSGNSHPGGFGIANGVGGASRGWHARRETRPAAPDRSAWAGRRGANTPRAHPAGAAHGTGRGQGSRDGAEGRSKSAVRPGWGQVGATEVHPTTRPGHPGASHPGGSEGPSGVANDGGGSGRASQPPDSWDSNLGRPHRMEGAERLRPMQAATGPRGASRGPDARYLRSGAPNLDRPWTSARARAAEAPPHHPIVASRKVPPRGFQWAERHCKRSGAGTCVPRGGRSGLAQEGPESRAAPPLSTPGGDADEADQRTNGPKAGRVERRRAGAMEQAQHVRRKPAGGPGPCGRGDPYHPGGASRQAPPRGFRRIERHCKRVGDGMCIPWAPRTGLAQWGHESQAALPLRTGGRSTGREDGARTGRQGA
ncbi:hypothetical protein COCNU_scaffold006362G000040 [Cocos nucifera]|nr:hypothetical protein [Cocos nucifera]